MSGITPYYPGQDVQQPMVHYGRLDEIRALQMTPVPDLELYFSHGEAKMIVFALIKPCITHGRDASVKKVRLNHNSALVDISFIKVAGSLTYSFHDDGRYGMIDRLQAEQCAWLADRGNLLPFWTLYFTLLVSFLPFWFAQKYSSITCKITLDAMLSNIFAHPRCSHCAP